LLYRLLVDAESPLRLREQKLDLIFGGKCTFFFLQCYRSHLDPRTELRMRIREIAQSRVRYEYRKIRALLNREGWNVGKYLVCRLYKEEGMTLKKMRPQRKRKAIKHREERFQATGPNQAWSIDFVADQLQDGRRFRALTVVDIFTREGVAIEVGRA
jgi:putative transposase